MPPESAKPAVDAFINLLNRSLAGEPVDPFSIYDDNVHYERHGLGPNQVNTDTLAEARVKLLPPVVLTRLNPKPGSGLYPIDYLEEGNRAVVVLKGRVTARNIPYNNTYFFLFEVKDGKIVRGLEDLDGSLSLRCLFNVHLEEGTASGS